LEQSSLLVYNAAIIINVIIVIICHCLGLGGSLPDGIGKNEETRYKNCFKPPLCLMKLATCC